MVINLDAANNSESGTTWTNLVGGSYPITSGTFQNSGGIQSILFNGSTFVDIGSPISTNSNFTKEAWVFDDSGAGSRNIISSSSNVFWVSSTTLNGGVNNAYFLVSKDAFPINTWKHVVMTFDDQLNTMRLYIDGVEVGENTNVSQSYVNEVERIGSHVSGSTPVSFWRGKIAKVKIYTTALCAAQVVSSFNTDAPTFGRTATTSKPCVTSSSVTESTGVVSVSGHVTLDGLSSVTERGFVYGTSVSPIISNNKILIGSGTGVFSGTSPTLSSGTYYFRAFATNSVGTTYGAQTSVTIVARSLSPTSQTISGSVNGAISNSSTITASNFTGAVTYAVTSGSLPAGLALNSSTGVISGTPTASSSSTITVTGTGATAGSATTSVTFAITAVAPSAPVINSITAGDGQLSVNFTAASNGGSAITNYKYSINGSTYIAFSPAVTTSPLVITGLTNSTSYPVTIKAVNAINDSSASNSILATPVAVVVPTDSGGSSSSSSPTPTSTPTPTPTPSASASVKPRVERINTNPLNIPIPGIETNINPIPGSRTNPEQLVKTDVEQLSEILKPKDIDLGKTITDLNFNASKALQFITNTEDKKVVDLASLVTIGGQTQSSRLVIVDNTSAQVVTAAGGVLAVQAKDGVNLVPVNDLGRVQMIRNNTVETQGSGLAPNTEFAVYLFSEPTLLGIGKTDAQGKFFVSFPVTVDLPIGDHTLQINGKLVNGQASSVSMPVSIVETAEVANSKAMPKTILIDVDPVDKALDAVYWLFFVLLVIVLLAVLTNRQKFFFFFYRKRN